MKINKLLGLFSAAILGCGLLYGGPNFCPNCGQCLKPKLFPQRFGMPPPRPIPCMNDCKKDCKDTERHFKKGRRFFGKKTLETPTPDSNPNPTPNE